jgi:hypothetical protein
MREASRPAGRVSVQKRYLCDFYHKTRFEPPAWRPRPIGIAAKTALLATTRAKRPNGETPMKTILTAAIAALAIAAGVAGSTTSASAHGYGYGYRSYGYGYNSYYVPKTYYYGYNSYYYVPKTYYYGY